MSNWYDDMPELGEVPDLTPEQLHMIALRQTYSLGYWLDQEHEARTDALLAESIELDYAALERWIESRNAADPFYAEVSE